MQILSFDHVARYFNPVTENEKVLLDALNEANAEVNAYKKILDNFLITEEPDMLQDWLEKNEKEIDEYKVEVKNLLDERDEINNQISMLKFDIEQLKAKND